MERELEPGWGGRREAEIIGEIMPEQEGSREGTSWFPFLSVLLFHPLKPARRAEGMEPRGCHWQGQLGHSSEGWGMDQGSGEQTNGEALHPPLPERPASCSRSAAPTACARAAGGVLP